jgi:alanine dehydrogenase
MKYYPEPYHGLSYNKLNQVIEEIFSEHAKKRVQMPPKLYVTLEKGDFRTMPAYIPALEIAGVKIVSVYPMNREKGVPTVVALTVILDIETGIPVAIVNEQD